MRDPALWTSWYVVLLLFPFMIIILLLCDFRTGRDRRRRMIPGPVASVDFADESSHTGQMSGELMRLP